MIQSLNGSGRRILTYPDVHPCDDIAPNTLLELLISLAYDICYYKTEFFPTNNRNAKEVIRQIGVILVFLEEVRERDSDLPDSAGLCFSELHLAFQKIRYLLEDCTSEGSRLCMLMKSDRVANQFRVLMRAISTALDVLPLGLIDPMDEINSHVELVIRQARKKKFELDPNDKRVKETLVSVWNGFENGIIPDKDSIKRVLDYLGIRSWSMCNKEMKFLDSEIGLVTMSSSDEKNELGGLCSLMGFVCYARCVVFDIVDGETSRQSENNPGNWVLANLNPDDFRCPISLEIMVDPVTIETGHTYDRSSILKWFGTGKSICPKTGTKLTNPELLVPNLVMRKLIQQYCSENGIPSPETGRRNRHVKGEILVGCLAAEKAMKMVTQFLSCILANGTKKEKNKASYEIRILAKTSNFNRSCLVEAGVVPKLLKLLLSTDSWTQENAIAALLNLSKHSGSKTAIVENWGLEYIVDVLKHGVKMEARQHAAGTLFYLASVEEYRILIGDNPEVIPALLELIKDGTNRAKKNSLVAIFGLLMHHGNHWRVLASGVVPLLVNLLASSDREDLITDSLAILATLAEKIDGTVAILQHGDLDSIVKALNSSTSRVGKEYCVSLLLALCTNGGKDVVAVLVKNPTLMGYLYSLLTDGTSRAIKKASALIRILHEYCEKRSSGSMAHVLPQERSIHVW
ncbi:hypothetical protein FEM48_ZijujUnG0055200 [Ziziphus jujuba var. spinosa]|uniref:RING-type E3 ubiquitin transferase n=1 Tax=Ziziphus jujuba var. spinosa TaxID=714518 RepID=A0A978U990_ZIZJJ|nr:U-box domain-containing protein 19-like [Ziziphus jujuba var. spinosa]KAH7511099.1 hypothetical protein FEM48_ZijujUnG0055200 [Ziziphus jujuba var. spinosa]